MSPARQLLRALLAILVILHAAPATASRPVEQRRFSFDPAMGYILVRAGPTDARGRLSVGPILLAQLDRSKGQGSLLGLDGADRRENFDAAVIRGDDHWGTDGRTALYLLPVSPGTWVIGSSGNTAFSMGSWGFEVRAGEITYLGTILAGRQNGDSPIPEIAESRLSPDLVSFGTLMNIVMSDTILVRPAAEGEALPAGLTAHPVRRAELIPDVRFNNFALGLIGRALGLPAMGHAPLVAENYNPYAMGEAATENEEGLEPKVIPPADEPARRNPS